MDVAGLLGKDPPSMLVIALLMVLTLALAGAVVTYVAYPHRGEEVPGAPWLGDAMKRGVDTVGELLDTPGHSGVRERADR
jgi:hypothetical protein